MREILFRGKRKLNGEWINGSLLVYGDGDCDICVPDGYDALDKFRVEPDTVGQYTGLTDKNGTKIFEGDIVDILNENEETGVIEWAPGEAMFVISSDGWCASFDNYWGKDVEVIGNIHDNPELLGGADNG